MFNAFQAIQAGRQGRADREQRERKNAFAQAGEAYMGGDYKGAASALMPYDMRAGVQMAQFGQQQQAGADKEKLRKLYEGTKALT
ncbi:MAG: hypothetical protein NXH88_09240, partial [Hyphomonas sp.]|nr:hypothetical protein [Hyphomonas sp.]